MPHLFHRLLPAAPLALAAAVLLAACLGQAGASSAGPAGCPAMTPLALPTGAPGAGPGGPGGPGAPGGPSGQPGAPPAPGAGFPGGPGGPGARQAGPTPTLEPPPTLAPMPSGALRFQVTSGRSTATFRVREQLAGISFPSDAVGCTSSVTGQLVVQPDGTFVSNASRITVDLRDLKSNSNQRDTFIKMSTIQTSRYPLATFVPLRAEGLPSPLPERGTATFKLTGQLTVHGVTKEQTWDVTATRAGNQLTGNATTSFTFEDYGMSPPRVPVVLSVVDEIRLEVHLEAMQGG